MAESDCDVRINLKAGDLSGGLQTTAELEKVRAAAKKANAETESGLGLVSKSFGKVSQAANLFKNVLGGFGAIAAIKGLISTITSIAESFGHAKKEADEFANAAKAEAVKKQIDDLASSYESLKKSIDNANQARKRENELADIRLKNKHDLEDAQIDLEEQKELEAVNPGDSTADEQRAAIKARYAERRTSVKSNRTANDIANRITDLEHEARDKRAEADKIDASAGKYDEAIKEAEERLAQYENASTALNNEDDDTSYLANAKNSLGKVFSLNWDKLGDYRTDAGDKIRDEAKRNAEQERQRIKELKKERDAQYDQSRALREQADQAEAKSNAIGGEYAVYNVRSEVDRRKAESETATSQSTLDKKVKKEQKKKDEEAEELGSAITASEELQREKIAAEQRKAQAEKRRDEAKKAQFEAQSNFDLVSANKGDVRTAAKKLDEAKRNAAAVDRETTALITSLTESLKSIESRLKAANDVIQKNSSQTRYGWSMQPAG